jgi:hypothetical protein
MKRFHGAALVVVVLSSVTLACSLLAPSGAPTPGAAGSTNTQASVAASPAATEQVAAATATEASAAESTATGTARPAPTRAPTAEPLRLEVVQSQSWTDYQSNARVNVLLRNPYDFPVHPSYKARVSLLSSTGELIRDQELYFLDGLSGGGGYLLPGETVAATACFNCEQAPLDEEGTQVEFIVNVEDATDQFTTFTDVEANVSDVAFDGDSPIFWITGSVKNNTEAPLQRISVRTIVYDQGGNLVGAAEVSAWDVPAGATAEVNGYGIGLAPEGDIDFEVSAVGVNY